MKTVYIATTTDGYPQEDGYKAIYVGTSYKKGELSDHEGVSIAQKNPYYCELTALYWIWKNLDIKEDDVLGLCHYRRFFDLANSDECEIIKTVNRNEVNDKISLKNIGNLRCNEIVLPVKEYFCKTVWEQYSDAHRESDLVELEKIIKNDYPEYLSSFKDIFMGNSLHFYNMFISYGDFFNQYMEWLFDILFKLENNIKIPYDDPVQRRVFGYISERLLNVYVRKHNLNVREFPVIFLSEKNVIKRKDLFYKMKIKYPGIVRMCYKMYKKIK